MQRQTPQQGELSFDDQTAPRSGYDQWVANRRIAARALARRIGLPLGQQVEIWLRGGVRLRGVLHLQEEFLFVEEGALRHLGLKVDRVEFTYKEIESCVRLD